MRTMVKAVAVLLAAMPVIPTASAQTGDATTVAPGVASRADIQAQTRAMIAEMKPGQGFMWRPVLRDGKTVAAIEIWKKPGRPAVHPADAEYAIVLEGAGTLLAGGTMSEPKASNPGLIEGSRIENGTSRALAPGDVILIPAGVPHWFGIAGDRLILLGVKLPASK